jgi:hypothetical protein
MKTRSVIATAGLAEASSSSSRRQQGRPRTCTTLRDATLRRITGILTSIIAGVVMVLAAPAASAAPPSETSGSGTGMQITARWWQVALRDPSLAFFTDDSLTGDNCQSVTLPSRTYVIAAGSFGESGSRACTVPAGATVVLPVINNLFILTDPRPEDTIGEARLINRDFIDVAKYTAAVDGVAMTAKRLRSPSFTVPGDLFGFPSTPLQAASDGYWLLWTATPGTHHVVTSGSSGDFLTTLNYTFVVS